MSLARGKSPHPLQIAIACGGTGGHLFPGLAIADLLESWGHQAILILSEKAIDRQAADRVPHECMAFRSLGWQAGQRIRFLLLFPLILMKCMVWMLRRKPDAILAMGGFTSLAPCLAACLLRKPVFFHESNAIPGRAIRYLSKISRMGFVGFESALQALGPGSFMVSGTPVRRELRSLDRSECCQQLGLDASKPIILITGGSQGAMGVNQQVVQALPEISRRLAEAQFIHLCGMHEDIEKLRFAYTQAGFKALVFPFLEQMELALGAATVAVGRSGASFIAEIVALGLPTLLIPFPHSADAHQQANAQTMAQSGAAFTIEEAFMTPTLLTDALCQLASDQQLRHAMAQRLKHFDTPESAACILEHILHRLGQKPGDSPRQTKSGLANSLNMDPSSQIHSLQPEVSPS